MLFSSAEVKEHTKLYVTATPVTQKREKVPSYLLFARLSARSSPLIFFFEYKKHRIERCFFCIVVEQEQTENQNREEEKRS